MAALIGRVATALCVVSALLTAPSGVLCAEDETNAAQSSVLEDAIHRVMKAVSGLETNNSLMETDVLQLIQKVGLDTPEDPESAASSGKFDQTTKNFLGLLASADKRRFADIVAMAKPDRSGAESASGIRDRISEIVTSAAGVAADQRAPLRRLQVLGIPPLKIADSLAGLGGVFRSGLSARDRDLFETFARHVHNSRERLYKDLIFVTGGKQHGVDEFSMKQLVNKVGLENLASLAQQESLGPKEAAVAAAARRSRLQVDRIIATYVREVGQQAKTLEKSLEADFNSSAIQSKIASIAFDGLFRERRAVNPRRLSAVAELLQGPGLLGSAGSLIRAIDPANMSESLSSALGGLGLHHLQLPNLRFLPESDRQPLLPSMSSSSLRSALEEVFGGPQRASALVGPLRVFQQGVSTATDGTISAFLSNEGIDHLLDVHQAKQLLGGLIGGESVAPRGIIDWHDVGIPGETADELAKILPFDSFLGKLRSLAYDVDAEVGALREDTERRIRSQGVQLLPEEISQLSGVMDRLVWGTFQAPVRRLQEVDETTESEPRASEQQSSNTKQETQEDRQEKPGPEQPEEQPHGKQPHDDPYFLLGIDSGNRSPEDDLDLALLKVELLSDAVNVLLEEYEKAVHELQQQLQLQIEAAGDVKLFVKKDAQDWKGEVAALAAAASTRRLQAEAGDGQQQEQEQLKQSAQLRIASQEAAGAYDLAMQGMRESVQGFLQRQPELSPVTQQQVEALAAKIEATVEERLPHLGTPAA